MAVFGMRKVRKRVSSVLWEGFCGTGGKLGVLTLPRVKSWQSYEEVRCMASQRVAELEKVKGE